MKTKLTLLIILLLFVSSFAYAGRPLEVEYISVPKIGAPETTSTSLSFYVIYIFRFFLYTSSLLVFISVLIGGFKYLTSAGEPGKRKEAREQIIFAFAGVGILLGSWLLLYTINPSLISLQDPDSLFTSSSPTVSPGVLLCKEEISNLDEPLKEERDAETMKELKKDINEECVYVKNYGKVWIRAEHIYIIPTDKTTVQGAFFYSAKFEKTQVVYSLSGTENFRISKFSPMSEEIRYALPFRLSLNPSYPTTRTVKLYKYIDMEENEDNPEPLVFEHEDKDSPVKTFDLRDYNYNNGDGEEDFLRIGSIKIDPPGTYVLFFKDAESYNDWNENADPMTILQSLRFLTRTKMQDWREECKEEIAEDADLPYPCATHMMILSNF